MGISPPRRSIPIIGLITLVLLSSFFAYTGRFSNFDRQSLISAVKSKPKPEHVNPHDPIIEPDLGEWAYNPSVHANDYSLTGPQCRSAFPKLFVELDKSVALYRDKPITFKSIDARPHTDGQVRVLIHKGRMRILEFGWMNRTESRAKSTLSGIYRAIMAAPDRSQIPDVEFIFDTEDYTEEENAHLGPIWTYTKREQDKGNWLMPDFGYYSWPEIVGEYDEIRERIQAVDEATAFPHKDPRLIWRGAVNTSPEIRGALVNESAGMKWSDVRALDWTKKEDIKKNLIKMEDHCKYQFVAHTEGRSYSGRGKYLLNCNSVFFTHPLAWIEAHHAAMNCATFLPDDDPIANCVQVKQDWSDLGEKIEYLLEHPEQTERIARKGVEDFRDRYLTPAAEACHWREMIKGWSEVTTFVPEYYEEIEKRKARGIAWESFILKPPLRYTSTTFGDKDKKKST
jgi:hypothetical protein